MDNTKKLKQWSLPEHTLAPSQQKAQAYTKVSLSTPQKKALEEMIRKEKERGYLEGKREGLQELLPMKQSLLELMQAIQQNTQVQSTLFEQQAHEIIKVICYNVIQQEMNTNPAILENILKEAISTYHDSNIQLKVRANQKTLSTIKSNELFDERLKLIEDNQLADCQFKLDANNQIVEFDIHKAILKHFH